MGELPVVRRFDGCTMTLGGEEWQFAILAVYPDIIREHHSLTMSTREDNTKQPMVKGSWS